MTEVLVELGELALCARDTDLEALDLAEPALYLRLGDAGDEVVADLHQTPRSVPASRGHLRFFHSGDLPGP